MISDVLFASVYGGTILYFIVRIIIRIGDKMNKCSYGCSLLTGLTLFAAGIYFTLLMLAVFNKW